ncbi:PREDICTED: pentatricopeptide repeat-containing protein At1g26460, mitochondrial-like [Tarenaya hassleriana]|uniref:pentatricopeptide repeat-containing protein At1g26460, mitochondrial-like n=1 Tax=Tarenaya hassleriana TaxID=28532 RepID=UPI00053C63A1|nr:PREDICTED: pentatricopeptide repeat-containing protein At1g26460, mitochondrial-like [Tarenaya hassleriana]XP_010527741.1 PREDICTED: pentatricopeptide repeat-containing protein At1g26460, mitochondrial-like [Tarenaya hassleriana]
MSTLYLLTRSRISLLKAINPNHGSNLPIRSISATPFLSQEPQLAAESAEPEASPPRESSTPLPPNPSTGNPLYQENWRNPIPGSESLTQSLVPLGFLGQSPASRIRSLAETLDMNSLLNLFADWTASQRWSDMKQLFECWVRTLDQSGKLNMPDVNLYNQYLRANLMMGASAGDLLDLVAQMDNFKSTPNTASFNLVLKAMHLARETEAAQKLLERMLLTGKESLPDDESYDLVVSMLFSTDQIDAALKYLEMALKSGYMLSMTVFGDCVRSCAAKGRTETLVSVIEKCKAIGQNKSLCPNWTLCNYIAEAAIQDDNSKLAFYGLEFMFKWIARGEMLRPSVLLSVDEGLIVSLLATAARTCSSTLLDASWTVLQKSLRDKMIPNPETYLAKVNAHASLGNLQKAFATLREFESAYANSDKEVVEEMFSPFTSLHPLVVACSKKGFETLDAVYFQLENLSRADPPYKSVAALNCIILGCANTWDLDRAYQTFEAISGSFGLTPNIHSYNALLCAFGKLKKTFEATRVFDHLVSIGVKPDTRTYSFLVDAHLINRDPKSALSVIDDMVNAGFEPSKETLKKVRRRCTREMAYETDDRVETLVKNFKIRMGTENRRNMLFNLDYSTGFQS